MTRSKVRQPINWLVLLAFLFSTLTPSLAMGLGGSEASRTVWAQLCGVNGSELIAIQVDGEPEAAQSKTLDAPEGHCLLCFQPSTPPGDVLLAPATRIDFVRHIAPVITSPPQDGTCWGPALARAPPAVS